MIQQNNHDYALYRLRCQELCHELLCHQIEGNKITQFKKLEGGIKGALIKGQT